MKKVLFASTALVMTAGVAAADVTISGSANMGVKSIGGVTSVTNEIDFDVKGSGSTDSGISFGASVDLDASQSNTVAGADVGTGANDPEVFISYEGLTLTVGAVGSAGDQGGLKDVGFDEIGIDNSAEIGAFAARNVHVAYSFGDVNVAMSMDSTSGTNTWALGVNGSIDAFSYALGYAENGANDTTTATIGYSAGAVSANLFYVNNGTNTGQGIDISYTSGDLTVTAVYADNNGAGDQDAFGIGFAYDLGGATLAGGFGDAKGVSVADLGVSFSF